MKKYIIILFCIFSLGLVAQEKDSTTSKEIITKNDSLNLKTVEEQPIFPGCEDLAKENRFECFNVKIQEHIRKNLRYPDNAYQKGYQGKVIVSFIITKEGDIKVDEIKTDYEDFRQEVIRLLEKLPKMIPGKQEGKFVNVYYRFPINFKLR